MEQSRGPTHALAVVRVTGRENGETEKSDPLEQQDRGDRGERIGSLQGAEHVLQEGGREADQTRANWIVTIA